MVYLTKWKARNRVRQVQRKKNLTQKVADLSKIVSRRKPEVKWSQKNSTISPTYSFAGYNSLLDSIAQGTADNNARVGDAIRLNSLEMYMKIVPPGTFNFPVVYRVLVFFWKRNPDHSITNASMPALYLTDSATVSTTYAPLALKDRDNRASFQTIFDKVYVINPTAGDTVNNAQSRAIVIHKKFNFKGKIVQWSAGSTTAMTQNELFYLVITDNTNVSTVNTLTRVLYTDA